MRLPLVLHQTAPRLGAVEWNREEMARRVAGDPAGSLVVFPELSLTGYDLGAGARELAMAEDALPPVSAPDPDTTIVLGYPELAPDHRLYNAAGAARAGAWIARHRKRYLPTYGMFDEGRIFAPGARGPRIFLPHPDWPTAILICEELWHPALAYLAALRGARLVLVLAAAPGRGQPQSQEDGPRFRSHRPWRLLARTVALTHGLYLGLVNRVGAEEGVVFAGGSIVVGPDGEVLAEADHRAEDRLEVELEPERVRQARHPYSHVRDEDLALVRRELGDILTQESGLRPGDEQDEPGGA
ncbi:MAG: hypothetical protein JSU98_04205 [Gemmatimonadales bacterium]|nr:MAG: hypothetical protein JSU98_04205 [Gemmatimonadales bacterium]